MINAIIKGVMKLITSLVSTLLSPIDAVIASALPGLSNVFNLIDGFLNYILSYFSWAVSWTFLSVEVRSIIVLYFTFILTVPLAIQTVKLAIKWYDKLKL